MEKNIAKDKSIVNEAHLSAFAALKVRVNPVTHVHTILDSAKETLLIESHFSSPSKKLGDHQGQGRSRKRRRDVSSTEAANPANASRGYRLKTTTPIASESTIQEVATEINDLSATGPLAESTTKIGRSSSISDFDYDSYDTNDNQSDANVLLKRIPNQRLSTFAPTSTNVLASSREEWSIRLTDGDTLALVGQYKFWVRKGTISILGATIHPSAEIFRVHAPSTHSIPIIRHIRNPFGPAQQPALITIKSCRTGIRSLRGVSAKFARIWNRSSADLTGRSFSYVEASKEDPYKRVLIPLKVPPDWQSLFLKLLDNDKLQPKVIIICGPKGSGKSTCTRLLGNELINRYKSVSGFCLLDLDPGQPEYSPPGNVSLSHLRSYNFGPPFTHPLILDGSEDTLVRAHHIGRTTPRDDPYHYMHCSLELFAQYQRMLVKYPTCPLIINTCGWILGGGLEILEELVRTMKPTDVIYMSRTGPEEVMDVLQQVAHHSGSNFHTLPSQPSEVILRTSADFRTMQTLSYFHLEDSGKGIAWWSGASLHTVKPLQLPYAGDDPIILGIMILGEEVPIPCLSSIINGSVLGVVAVEDDGALPKDTLSGYDGHEDTSHPEPHDPDLMTDVEENFSPLGGPPEERQVTQGSTVPDQITTKPSDAPPRPPKPSKPPKPSIRRTAKENLPYLFIGHSANTPLSPPRTHCIGQVLIRAIDTPNHALQVITPIPASTFQRHKDLGHRLVLVRGRLDIPGWAYTEQYVAGLAADKERKRWRRYEQAGEVEDSEAVSDPEDFDVEGWAARQRWISLGRGNGGRRGKVWRVRRNLGARQAE